MSQAQAITTPVGRLVRGSLYKVNTTDAEGEPLVTKHGTNKGLRPGHRQGSRPGLVGIRMGPKDYGNWRRCVPYGLPVA